MAEFWRVRQEQGYAQGAGTGKRDAGERSAVTGGAQLDGFIRLVADLLVEKGVPQEAVFGRKDGDLPGFFRPAKEWDLLVVHNGRLLTALEFKSQVGPSFGNNYNNRVEEAIGNATDLWTAYREETLPMHPRPWIGYFLLLEEAPASTRPVRVAESHFGVRAEFRESSYASRYELFCKKLARERLYDGTCLLLSDRRTGPNGKYREPSPELSFAAFITSLLEHVGSVLR